MNDNFAEFVNDVQKNCTYSGSKVDEDNNIVVNIDNRTFMIASSELYAYYNSFKHSAYQYSEWVSRTAGHVNKLIDQWYKRWH